MARRSSNRNRSGRRPRPEASAPEGEPLYVDTPEVLDELCQHVRSVGRFAFDTEFVMEDRFTPEVCLIQVAADSVLAVVDPFKLADLSPIWDLVADPEIEVILHAGMEDLALCQTQGGRTPRNVFDCQVACGLVSPDYPLSLSRMIRGFLGVRLHKSQTLTDWRRRPLSADQIRYAGDDVAYLPSIRDELGKKLARRGRTEWLAEEMARFCTPDTYTRSADESLFKLKGAGGLDSQGLAIARELVKTREELALRFDRPVRAVVRDHLIVEIAKHRWTQPAEIKTLRGLNLRAEGVRALAEAVQRARALPREQWPAPAPTTEETDREAALAMLVGAVVRSYCADQEIAHQLVATKKDLRQYVRAFERGELSRCDVPLAQGWRGRSVGEAVQKVLQGRSKVTVTRKNGATTLHFE